MRLRRRKIGDEENTERWLLTYADLITLLLAFFVVMYSMSQIDAKRFGRVVEALNGVLKGGHMVVQQDEINPKTGHGLLKLGNLRMIQNHVEKIFEEEGKKDVLKSEVTERGLVVHIMEQALFKQGSAVLEPKAVEVLSLIADQLVDLPNHIRIEGHTDDQPISTSIYPSNWELSTVRATEVVKYLIENYSISPTRISALGYGEYRPVRPNNSIENRAANRRVDVVVMTMELTLKEPTADLYGEIDR